ncbi:MAG: tryptophan synthase subunit alpha [Candidatus Levybacteria bacterium RIFCSPHIGHO2_01_FULL_38_12]|nr:MAG: tryptophan synthase subunit alpha [Candidatus Levybacteria bacterium RIFCSPHIGHO2_01_FULL_38_12]
MNSIDQKLSEIKKNKKLGIMTHVVVGYPTLEKTVQIVKTMAECGADFVELQIPFSDPLADGPTIMKACEKSLNNGTKVRDCFKIAKDLSSQVSISLLFMAYYNTVFKYGIKQFIKDSKAAGISGLIVPDMSIDEEGNEKFYAYCKTFNLYNIQVISPASTEQRLRKNAKIAKGFVYCTARQGITGVKEELNPELSSYLKKVRSHFSIPLAVGFGISKKEHVKALKKHADIAVIGSAIINIINFSKPSEISKNVVQFMKNLDSK